MVDNIKDFELIRSFAILKPEKLNCMDPVELEFLEDYDNNVSEEAQIQSKEEDKNIEEQS